MMDSYELLDLNVKRATKNFKNIENELNAHTRFLKKIVDHLEILDERVRRLENDPTE